MASSWCVYIANRRDGRFAYVVTSADGKFDYENGVLMAYSGGKVESVHTNIEYAEFHDDVHVARERRAVMDSMIEVDEA